MSYLRTASTRRLLAIIAGLVIAAVGGTAIAVAAAGSGPVPGPKALPQAIHDALAAPKVAGITARITFTNHLISASDLQGSDPVLSGATRPAVARPQRPSAAPRAPGRQRRRADRDQRPLGLRLRPLDAHRLPVHAAGRRAPSGPSGAHSDGVPSLAEIQRELSRLTQHLQLSGAQPSDVGGQPAYTVSVSPRHDGGLLGSAELAWDATHGVPLRFAVYAHGNTDPVLELKADHISYDGGSGLGVQRAGALGGEGRQGGSRRPPAPTTPTARRAGDTTPT